MTDAYAAIAGADHRPRLEWVPCRRRSEEGDPETDDPHGEIADQFAWLSPGRRSKELERGLTLVGPHRDPSAHQRSPREGAPARRVWSVALARGWHPPGCRAESPPATGADPGRRVRQLDADRRQRPAAITAGYEQVIVTAAVGGGIPEALHGHVVRIHAGTISDERGPRQARDPVEAEGRQ
ncbi:hypothetical protein [Microbacterium sp.]|uniref:hypothetical protein n=1 Tax=Microbacterium sp. TaxID=51671 RepID=UPI003A9586B1